jgi:hypothetical protein
MAAESRAIAKHPRQRRYEVLVLVIVLYLVYRVVDVLIGEAVEEIMEAVWNAVRRRQATGAGA